MLKRPIWNAVETTLFYTAGHLWILDPTRWQYPLINYLTSIQETTIALAILHASCQVHCNPSRKTKVLGTPRSQLNPKKNTTLVSDTEPPSQVASEQSKIFLFYLELVFFLHMLYFNFSKCLDGLDLWMLYKQYIENYICKSIVWKLKSDIFSAIIKWNLLSKNEEN